MQEDTYLGNMADPLSLNLYTYCHNDPITYYDPNGYDSVKVIVEYNGYKWAASIENGVTTMADGSRPPAGAIVHTKDGDYVALGGDTPGVRVGSTNSSSTSGPTGSGSGNSGGGARGVDFGPNEGADWLRTGSGLTFEEFWGVTPYGMSYYTGYTKAPNSNTSNSSGGSGAGAWHNGTFMSQDKFTDLIIASSPYGNIYSTILGTGGNASPGGSIPTLTASGQYSEHYTSYLFYDQYLYGKNTIFYISLMKKELEKLYGGICLVVPVTTGLGLEKEWNKMNDSKEIPAVVIDSHGGPQVLGFTLKNGTNNTNQNDYLYINTIERFDDKKVNTVILISCNTGGIPTTESKNVAQAFLDKAGVNKVIAVRGETSLSYETVITGIWPLKKTTTELRIRVGEPTTLTDPDYKGYMLFNDSYPDGKALKNTTVSIMATLSDGSEREYTYEYKGLTELMNLANNLK